MIDTQSQSTQNLIKEYGMQVMASLEKNVRSERTIPSKVPMPSLAKVAAKYSWPNRQGTSQVRSQATAYAASKDIAASLAYTR